MAERGRERRRNAGGGGTRPSEEEEQAGCGGTPREVAQTAAIVKYTQLVVQWDAARREQERKAAAYELWKRRAREEARRAARQGEGRAASSGGAREGAGDVVQEGRSVPRLSSSISLSSSVKRRDACNRVGRAGQQRDGRKGTTEENGARGQGRRMGGGRGNGRLSMGVNLVAALQRQEWIGLSWRGVWDKG